MKICIVLPTLGNSGGNKIIYQLSKKLSREYEVDLFYPLILSNIKKWRNNNFKEFAKIIIWFLINLFRTKEKKLKTVMQDVNFIRITTLKKLPSNYDIYICTWWETVYYAPTNKKIYYYIQADESWCTANKYLVYNSYNLENVTNITISKYLANHIKKYSNKPVKIIYNELPFDTFIPKIEKKNFYSIGLIYRRNKWKNVDAFLSYLKKFKNPKLNYYVIGINIPKNVIKMFDGAFDGKDVEQMHDFYNSIGLLVLPSDENEGFGLPIIESMLMKTPVASLPVGIAYELAKDKENYLLLKSNDENGIKDAVEYYLNLQLNLKISLGCKAYETAKEYEFSVKKNTSEYIFEILKDGV